MEHLNATVKAMNDDNRQTIEQLRRENKDLTAKISQLNRHSVVPAPELFSSGNYSHRCWLGSIVYDTAPTLNLLGAMSSVRKDSPFVRLGISYR